jgi:hypothetical protein
LIAAHVVLAVAAGTIVVANPDRQAKGVAAIALSLAASNAAYECRKI